MVARQRAIAVAEKQARRNALLDAAETLFLAHPDRMASVAEVAGAAGLAKGTVYLYFPSKEEMLLALHERQMTHFFAALLKLLDRRRVVGFDEIWTTARDHLVRLPGYLPLTSRCLGLMDRDIPTQTAIAFKVRVGQVLAGAGSALERHFPALPRGGGVTLLQHSYGLILGLWQLMHPVERFGTAMERAELAMFKRDYERELEQALRSLWTGTLGGAGARAQKRRSR